jgi:hypothetical protein
VRVDAVGNPIFDGKLGNKRNTPRAANKNNVKNPATLKLFIIHTNVLI